MDKCKHVFPSWVDCRAHPRQVKTESDCFVGAVSTHAIASTYSYLTVEPNSNRWYGV